MTSVAAATPREELGREGRPTRRVVIAHPGRQYVYEPVLAAQQAGFLQGFATGVYLRPGSVALRAARVWPAWAPGSGLVRAGRSRSNRAIDPALVTCFPAGQIAARVLRGWPVAAGLSRRADARCDRAIAEWLRRLEPPPMIVHGFEGGALATFAAAKEAGAARVLDVACAHEYAQAALAREGAPITVDGTADIRSERELADYLLAPSEFVARCLLEHGVPAEKIVRLPFGADTAAFARGPRRPEGRFRALYVGAVGARKGLRFLLAAWRELDLPDAELVVIGRADAHGRRILRARRGACRWLGHVPHPELPRWYADSDVFVFPSLAEGSALVTYEAMAASLPVITTAESGSVVRDGVDGFVVPAGDVAALRERIALLHECPALRRELGTSARTRIETGFTWGHYRDRLRRVYEAIAAGMPPQAAVEEAA